MKYILNMKYVLKYIHAIAEKMVDISSTSVTVRIVLTVDLLKNITVFKGAF